MEATMLIPKKGLIGALGGLTLALAMPITATTTSGDTGVAVCGTPFRLTSNNANAQLCGCAQEPYQTCEGYPNRKFVCATEVALKQPGDLAFQDEL